MKSPRISKNIYYYQCNKTDDFYDNSTNKYAFSTLANVAWLPLPTGYGLQAGPEKLGLQAPSIAEKLIRGDGLDGQGCKCLVGEMTSVQSDNNLRSCSKGCCYPMAIIAMAGYVLSQMGRWIHHGFRKGSFHAGAEAMSGILGDSLIRHHVPEGVFQDPGRPMHPVRWALAASSRRSRRV